MRLLEHVGSTSVPGLAAKPIIDMLLVVADSADEAAYVPSMEAAGYVLRIREPDWFEHRLFKGPDTNVNVHILHRGLRRRSSGCSCSATGCGRHDDERVLYERAKRELAARDWTYVQDYADAKGDVVEAIIAGRWRTRPRARITSCWARAARDARRRAPPEARRVRRP